MEKQRNIQFLKNKIQYNAIKKFDGNVVKVPSYIIDEVFKKKIDIELKHRSKVLATYSYDNLFHFIEKTENKLYTGKFRNRDISYKLHHIRV